MKNSYVELDRLLRVFDAQQSNPLTVGQRETLVEIARREEDGLPTKITNLVQIIRLGTGPTVHNNLARLENDGFIVKTQSNEDGRARDLKISKHGRDYLNALDNLVRAAGK